MKKLLSYILIGTMTLGILSGCAKATPPTVETPTPAVETTPKPNEDSNAVVLNTVSMFGGNDPSAGAYQSLIKEYETQSGNTVQDASDSSEETWKASVVADFNTGNEPDVLFFFNGSESETFIDKVVSVDTIRETYPDYAKDINESALTTMGEPDGKTYAVPVKGFYEAIFVNKDMFEARDLELPTDWAKLETAIKAFAAEGISPFTISFAEEPHYLIETLIMSAGGVAEHSVSPTTDIASVPDSWYLGLNTIKTLADLGAFPSDAATKKSDTAQEDFYNGVSPMFIDGSWRVSGIVDRGIADSVVTLPFPVMPGGKGTGSEIIAGFSNGFYITKKAWDDPEKQKAAVDFVNVMTSKDGVSKLLGGGAGAPASEIEGGATDSSVIRTGNEMAGAASGSDMPVDSRLKKSAWAEIWSNTGNIADGSMTAEQVLEIAIPQNKN